MKRALFVTCIFTVFPLCAAASEVVAPPPAPVVMDASVPVSSLSLSAGETVVLTYSSNSPFQVSGDLNNAGQIFAVAADGSISRATIQANNIINTGIISTVTPQFLASMLPLSNPLNLQIVSAHDIINSGTISSSGNLTMIAGGDVINASSAVSTAVIAAQQNLAIIANSGNLTNSGMLQANLGNVNLSSIITDQIRSSVGTTLPESLFQSATDLRVSNVSGIISALNGDVFASGQMRSTTEKILWTGGTVDARTLNFETAGLVDAHLFSSSATINAIGDAAQIGVSSGELRLGDICLKGDPTYYSTTGDIVISGSLIANDYINVYAFGEIRLSGAEISAPALRLIAGKIVVGPTELIYDPSTGLPDPRPSNGGYVTGQPIGLQGPSGHPGNVILDDSTRVINAGTVEMKANSGHIILDRLSTINADFATLKADRGVRAGNINAPYMLSIEAGDGFIEFASGSKVNAHTVDLRASGTIVLPSIDASTVNLTSLTGSYVIPENADVSTFLFTLNSPSDFAEISNQGRFAPAFVTSDERLTIKGSGMLTSFQGLGATFDVNGGLTLQFVRTEGPITFNASSVGIRNTVKFNDSVFFNTRTFDNGGKIETEKLANISVNSNGPLLFHGSPGSSLQGYMFVQSSDKISISGNHTLRAASGISFSTTADIVFSGHMELQSASVGFSSNRFDNQGSFSSVTTNGVIPGSISISNIELANNVTVLGSGDFGNTYTFLSTNTRFNLPSMTTAETLILQASGDLDLVQDVSINGSFLSIGGNSITVAPNLTIKANGPVSLLASGALGVSGSGITIGSGVTILGKSVQLNTPTTGAANATSISLGADVQLISSDLAVSILGGPITIGDRASINSGNIMQVISSANIDIGNDVKFEAAAPRVPSSIGSQVTAAGALVIGSDFEFTSGTELRISAASITAGEDSSLRVTGQTNAGGSLRLTSPGSISFGPNASLGSVQNIFVTSDNTVEFDQDLSIRHGQNHFAEFHGLKGVTLNGGRDDSSTQITLAFEGNLVLISGLSATTPENNPFTLPLGSFPRLTGTASKLTFRSPSLPSAAGMKIENEAVDIEFPSENRSNIDLFESSNVASQLDRTAGSTAPLAPTDQENIQFDNNAGSPTPSQGSQPGVNQEESIAFVADVPGTSGQSRDGSTEQSTATPEQGRANDDGAGYASQAQPPKINEPSSQGAYSYTEAEKEVTTTIQPPQPQGDTKPPAKETPFWQAVPGVSQVLGYIEQFKNSENAFKGAVAPPPAAAQYDTSRPNSGMTPGGGNQSAPPTNAPDTPPTADSDKPKPLRPEACGPNQTFIAPTPEDPTGECKVNPKPPKTETKPPPNILERIWADQKDLKVYQENDSSIYRPVSYNTPMVASARIDRRFYAPQNKDLLVVTRHCTMKIPKGNCVLVVSDNERTNVFNLHDSYRKPLIIAIGNRVVKLPISHCLAISKSKAAQFDDVMLSNRLSFRDPKPINDLPRVVAFTSEFSPFSALSTISSCTTEGTVEKHFERSINTVKKDAAALSIVRRSQTSPFRTKS
ncbi:MAG: hypothetical protein K2W95_17715 [Candidatus Obscuribacterales bacterium]|nr:hypothetical protein [Candidatus Obscuribacterales bacterium]